MAGQINIVDGRINPVAANEGFLSTINPNTFGSVYAGTIKAGQQLQNLGAELGDFYAKQTAIENDNYANNAFIAFEKKKAEHLNFLKNDPKAKKISPIEYNSYVTDKLNTFRSGQLSNMPATQLEKFKQRTEVSLMSAQASALAHTKKVNDDGFEASTLGLSDSLLASVGTEGFDRQTVLNQFTSRVANGLLAGTYEPPQAYKMADKFREKLANHIVNTAESRLLQDPNTTLAEIKALGKKMTEDPDLDPLDKYKRQTALLTRWNTQANAQRKLLEDAQEEEDFTSWNILNSALLGEDTEKKTPGVPTITNEIIDAEIKKGYRDETQIAKFREAANRQRILMTDGEEDNSPELNLIDDVIKTEMRFVNGDITEEELSGELTSVLKKARKDPSLSFKEYIAITRETVRATKAAKNEEKTEQIRQVKNARRDIRRKYGGGDQAFDKYNSVREELLLDAVTTARLFIEGGDRFDVAVRKAEAFIVTKKDEGIQRFRGVSAADMIEKSRKGTLNADDRFVMNAMRESRKARDDRRHSQKGEDGKLIKTKIARDTGLGN